MNESMKRVPQIAAAMCLCAAAGVAHAQPAPPDLPPRGPAPASGQVAVYLTTQDLGARLQRQADLPLQAGAGRGHGANDISVNAATTYQTLSAGFGVALTDTSAYLLHEVLPPAQRDRVMSNLFSRTDGIGLSYLRIGMGGTDYNVSRQPYTYDDLPPGQTDPALRSFSLDHDRAYIIPAITQALQLNPNITVTTSPWSPPAWMKTDGQLVPSGPFSQLRSDAYVPWANYFVRFIQGYAAAGIPIHQVSVQNEPLNSLLALGIPGMLFPAGHAAGFVRNQLAPAFRSAGITSKILVWDFVWGLDAIYTPTIMALAGADVGAIGYHCYATDPGSSSLTHLIYQRPQFVTECASKLSNIEPAQMTIRALRNWLEGVQLWNAALDQNFGPKFGSGCRGGAGQAFAGQDCTAPITVDTTTRSYRFNADFWALGHFSRFIDRGARRIASSQPSSCLTTPFSTPHCGLEDVAVVNPDGSRVLVATSHNGQTTRFSVTENGRHFDYAIPDGAIATFVWRP